MARIDDGNGIDQWWLGMADAEIEREAARRYAWEEFRESQPRPGRLYYAGDLRTSTIEGDTGDAIVDVDALTDEDIQARTDARTIFAALRAACERADAANLRRGSQYQSTLGAMCAALGACEWGASQPNFSDLGRLLGIKRQTALYNYRRFLRFAQSSPDVRESYYSAKAELATRA